jgi:hypothetical protein
MMKTLAHVLCLAVLVVECVFAQTGSIGGKVQDEQSGEELVGTNVLVVGTSLGGTTDIEGRYLIKNLPPGLYDVRFSFVGYRSKVVRAVKIEAEGFVKMDVTLPPSALEADEVVVTAERMLATESALLSERKKAASIGDGISAEQIQRTPDATSGDALKRVVGVTLVDNKFVYIRGTSERYNATQLNGVEGFSTKCVIYFPPIPCPKDSLEMGWNRGFTNDPDPRCVKPRQF